MPLYEYRCRGCEAEFELLILGETVPACPGCSSGELDKLVSAPSVRSGSSTLSDSACPPPEAGPCGPACCRV